MTSPSSYPAGAFPVQQRPRTWTERNWKWFVPLLIVGALLLLGAFVGGLFYVIEASFRSSYPYQVAVKRATESQTVAAKLGTPLHIGWLVSGKTNYNGAEASASLSIPVAGPNGKGSIVVIAKKRAKRWSFETMEVDIVGQDEPISLLDAVPVVTPNPPDRPI
jgi:Cytochrome oxidase complex assembly protein 1